MIDYTYRHTAPYGKSLKSGIVDVELWASNQSHVAEDIQINQNHNSETYNLWPRMIKDWSRFLLGSRLWSSVPHTFTRQAQVPEDYFGINVASAEDPVCDDYVVCRLRELGINHVRLNFTYLSFGTHEERFLTRLLSEGFDVMLNLAPPCEDASKMHRGEAAQSRWRDFLQGVFEAFGESVSLFEIGSTPNRRRWSGFSYRDYIKLWEVACASAKAKNLPLAGPNVSDFEPLHNIALLSWMRRVGRLPDVHTDNLFVERVIEPEAFDHRVAGPGATRLLKLNLVKKAGILQDISRRFGIPKTYCIFTCWNSRRLLRWGVHTEAKKADYLVRYLVIAAAGGMLQRCYWGPLIGYLDGLIDDGIEKYPGTERVTRYANITGQVRDFRPGPAFDALANVVRLLKGARCLGGVCADNGICAFEFAGSDAKRIRVAWTRDRTVIPLTALYPDTVLDKAQFIDCEGKWLARDVLVVSERPVFIVPDEAEAHFAQAWDKIANLPPLSASGTIFAHLSGMDFMPWNHEAWRGAIAVPHGEDAAARASCLSPEALETMTCDSLLRDKRNRVWRVQDPLCEGRRLVVKRIQVLGLKRFTYRFRKSKAQRNWNNASEMLRLGVATPLPVAFFERKENAALVNSYYVCEHVEDAFSARQAFASFRAGDDEFAGSSKPLILNAIAHYVWHMHSRKIIHQDLSSGNLLLQKAEEGKLRVTIIDIGRARIVKRRSLSQRERFLDLMRICYKLNWPDREDLLRRYFGVCTQTVPRWSRLPLHYYDWKYYLKRGLQRRVKSATAFPHKAFLGPRYWPTWILFGAMRAVTWLPYPKAMNVGRVFGKLVMRLAKARRDIAWINLSLCFPEVKGAERRRLLARHFESLGMSAVETALCWWAPKQKLQSLAHIEGLEHLETALEQGRGAILLSAHFTTLEIGGTLLADTVPISAVYRGHKNPLFDTIMRDARNRHAHIVPRGDIHALLRALKGNLPVWYAPDQDSGRKQRSLIVPFFGVPAASLTSTSRIAKLAKAPVIPFFAHRLEDGSGYRLVLHPPLAGFPSDDIEEDTRRINELIEQEVRKHPEHYLWVHRRFKTHLSDSPRPYREHRKWRKRSTN